MPPEEDDSRRRLMD